MTEKITDGNLTPAWLILHYLSVFGIGSFRDIFPEFLRIYADEEAPIVSTEALYNIASALRKLVDNGFIDVDQRGTLDYYKLALKQGPVSKASLEHVKIIATITYLGADYIDRNYLWQPDVDLS